MILRDLADVLSARLEEGTPGDPGLIGPEGQVWRVAREKVVLAGGPAALLLQLAHPLVAAGVADHSEFETQPLHRLTNTLTAVLTATFGDRDQAEAIGAAGGGGPHGGHRDAVGPDGPVPGRHPLPGRRRRPRPLGTGHPGERWPSRPSTGSSGRCRTPSGRSTTTRPSRSAGCSASPTTSCPTPTPTSSATSPAWNKRHARRRRRRPGRPPPASCARSSAPSAGWPGRYQAACRRLPARLAPRRVRPPLAPAGAGRLRRHPRLVPRPRCAVLPRRWRFWPHERTALDRVRQPVPGRRAARQWLADDDDLPVIAFPSQDGWRAWLDEHHATSPGLWIKIAKKATGIPTVTHAEALDVALCYGWIDGQRNGFDDTWFLQRYTPRRPKSKWSQINRGQGRRPDRAGPHAAGRPPRGRAGQGRRPVGGGLPVPAQPDRARRPPVPPSTPTAPPETSSPRSIAPTATPSSTASTTPGSPRPGPRASRRSWPCWPTAGRCTADPGAVGSRRRRRQATRVGCTA